MVDRQVTPGLEGPATGAQAHQPHGCTNYKLRALLRRVAQHYDAELVQSGLKTTQFSLLTQLKSLGPIRPGDLAAALGMDASTLTRNLKPLVAMGWVSQVAGADGRSRLVSLTQAGLAKRQEALQRWRAAQEGLNALLGVDTVVALHALVDDSLVRLGPSAHAAGLNHSARAAGLPKVLSTGPEDPSDA